MHFIPSCDENEMCKIYLRGAAVPVWPLRVTSATCHLLAVTGCLQFTHGAALHFKGTLSATSCWRLLSGHHRGEIRARLRKPLNTICIRLLPRTAPTFPQHIYILLIIILDSPLWLDLACNLHSPFYSHPWIANPLDTNEPVCQYVRRKLSFHLNKCAFERNTMHLSRL